MDLVTGFTLISQVLYKSLPDMEEDEMKRLDQKLETALNVLTYGGLICYAFLSLVIMAMIGVFAWNKVLMKSPTFIKVALPSYLLYSLFTTGFFVYVLTLDYEDKVEFYKFGTAQALLSIIVMLFVLLHWQFAAHYLKSAILFKMTMTATLES